MKKFEEFINETLDTPYKYKWTEIPTDMDGDFYGRFKSVNNSILMNIYSSGTDDPIWIVEFGPTRSTSRSIDVGLTGKGDAFRIISTVIVMIKDAIKIMKESSSLKIEEIYFTADKYVDGDDTSQEKTGRVKLYKRLVQKYIKDIGTIKMVEEFDFVEFYIKVK